MSLKTLLAISLFLLVNSIAVFILSGKAHAKPSATFSVNDTTDLIDDDLADGICHTAAETCTLRAAIMQANALGGMNTISLPAGIYTLTIPGAYEDYALTGDLDIQNDLTINGTGATAAIVNGNQLDRLFEVFNPAKAIMSGITIRNGNAMDGGGIKNHGALWISDTVIIDNRAIAGGGIFNSGIMRITNSIIESNSSNGNGANCGGIGNAGNLETANTIVRANQTSNAGGGICNSAGATSDLQTLTVVSNTAQYGAGIFNTNNATLTVSYSLINNNVAQVSGGGISAGGQCVLLNTTVSGNIAQFAGGGIENGGSASIINVTLSGNYITNTQAGGTGGNIYTGYNSGSSIQLFNTIIANSSTTGNCHFEPGTFIISLGHNLSDDNTCNLNAMGDITNANPLLGPLQNNGGTTLTHALLSTSLAINAGDNTNCPPNDQRGVSRPQAGICDIGAYEFVFPFLLYFPVLLR
ncbi:MAG: hypothetical protein FJ009_20220 [Chloroflexi bacterium]|nr:hypothetical protein [Chloroflexota bacterium]